MATTADLSALALALPETTKELSGDGRPTYKAQGKMFICHRSQRADAIDPETGERLDDVLVFRVENLEMKEILLADDREIMFTTPHFKGYAAVLVRIPSLARLDIVELEEMVVEAWLTRVHTRVARAWLAEHAADDD